MGSQPIQQTIINMLMLADEQLANIFLLRRQGQMLQADLLNRMVISQLKCIQDLQVKLSDATPAPRRYSGSEDNVAYTTGPAAGHG